MARLEYIQFAPWREVICEQGETTLERDEISRCIERLPQIYWASGDGWAEANHWALEKASEVDIETVKSLMKHLHAYAVFLEETKLDWRHFPIKKADRAVVRFRGQIVDKIKAGVLLSSTGKARMAASIQFYRHSADCEFVGPNSPMWREKTVVVNYHDAMGFARSMTRITNDLAISNNQRPGFRLEDGLLPLRVANMMKLLSFTSLESTLELDLKLRTGFFTGARFETVVTMRIENLEQAYPDPFMRGFFLMAVGPGTGVATKFDVKGSILVPDFILEALKKYAYSTERLKREAKAQSTDKTILFLTKHGRPYSSNSFTRLMTDLRRSAMHAGLRFMERFKFHQTRATYGTWLMKLALSVTSSSNAVGFVKNAMLHKNESTTLGYVKFLENTKGKQEVSREFHALFTGLNDRNWDQWDA